MRSKLSALYTGLQRKGLDRCHSPSTHLTQLVSARTFYIAGRKLLLFSSPAALSSWANSYRNTILFAIQSCAAKVFHSPFKRLRGAHPAILPAISKDTFFAVWLWQPACPKLPEAKSRIHQREIIAPRPASIPDRTHREDGHVALGSDFFRGGAVGRCSWFYRNRPRRRGNRQDSFLCIRNSLCAFVAESRCSAALTLSRQKQGT